MEQTSVEMESSTTTSQPTEEKSEPAVKMRFSIANLLQDQQQQLSHETIEHIADEDEEDFQDEEEIDVSEDVDEPTSFNPSGPIRPTPVNCLSTSVQIPPVSAAEPPPRLSPILGADDPIFASPHASHQLLYSQWLATRNTNIFFGLQGKIQILLKNY